MIEFYAIQRDISDFFLILGAERSSAIRSSEVLPGLYSRCYCQSTIIENILLNQTQIFEIYFYVTLLFDEVVDRIR